MTSIGLRHWLAVLAIALAVHAALFIRFQVDTTLPVPSANAGTAGVRIALAPKQGKPKQEQVATNAAEPKDTPGEETAPASKPGPEPKPKDQTVPTTELKSETTPNPEPKPAPRPKPGPASNPKIKPKAPPKQTPEPEPKIQPKPQTGPKSESEPTPESKPPSKPKPKQKPKTPAEPKPIQRPKRQSTSPRLSRSAQRAEDDESAEGQDRTTTSAQAAQTAKQTKEGTTGSVSDTPADYRSELSAALQRHKNYPRRARRLGREGTVVLHFVMDRNGRVLNWEIRRSSGHEMLDDAVRNMIRKANPLPALPDSVSMQRLAITVPISFRLR